jgi:hypothetical protein
VVVAPEPKQQLVQAVRVDLPPHRAQRRPRAGVDEPQRRAPRVVAHALGHVVVDAEEVDRRRDHPEVTVEDDVERAVAALEQLDHVSRIRAAQHRVEEPTVEMTVQPRGRRHIDDRLRRRVDRREVQGDPDARVRSAGAAQRRDRQSVREQQVVRHPQRRHPVADARRLCALRVPEEGDNPRLVVGDPLRHHVAEAVRHQRRVLREALGGVAHRPAPVVLARRGQVPVVQRRDRLDAALEQPLGEPAVERHAARVQPPAAVGLHARPRDREAVALERQPDHQVEVRTPAPVLVARDLAAVAARDRAREPAEVVRAPALAYRALDLVGGGRRAEPERAHPFTAPAVSPRTSQRWVKKNASRTGIVETTPAAISWSYSWE